MENNGAGENPPLDYTGDHIFSYLVLNLRLDIIDRIGWFHIKGNSFTSQRLDKNLCS